MSFTLALISGDGREIRAENRKAKGGKPQDIGCKGESEDLEGQGKGYFFFLPLPKAKLSMC